MNKTFTKFIKTNILLIVILLVATIVRFYNFSDRITFGPEQAISLLVSGDYIHEKFSLLGLPNVQRTTTFGHILYSSPVFNYSLVPLMVIFNNEPAAITGYFALLNLATGLVLFIVTKKIFHKKTALFTLVLFLFNDLMIFHSMFIWIINYLPLINIFILYLFFRYFKNKDSKLLPFLIGLLLSICFGLEYVYLFTALVLIGIMIYLAGKRMVVYLFFVLGAVLGSLPTVIFDLMHNFYHVRTLWQYLLDILANPGQSLISYYHFLQFWPVLALLGGLILSKIYDLSKSAALILIISYILINLVSPRVSFSKPVGMYYNLNFSKVVQAAKIIAGDNPSDFNVVMTFDFDSRAHPLRYLLKYNFGYQPLGVEDYPNADILYVLTTRNYPIDKTSLWEISSFHATTIEKLAEIDGFIVYKLSKIQQAFLLQ